MLLCLIIGTSGGGGGVYATFESKIHITERKSKQGGLHYRREGRMIRKGGRANITGKRKNRSRGAGSWISIRLANYRCKSEVCHRESAKGRPSKCGSGDIKKA